MIKPHASGADGPQLLPEEGIILGADSEGPLAKTPTFEWRTRSGDLVVAASHHGYGYKSVNEDRVALVEAEGTHGPNLSLFVVDGMGGRESGDLAAQILSEELVNSARPVHDEIEEEMALLVRDQIEGILWTLPGRNFVRRVLARWRETCPENDGTGDASDLIRGALEAVNDESLKKAETKADRQRVIAEVLRELAEMTPPAVTEVYLRRAQRRIVIQHLGSGTPDACFVGGLIRTREDGRRQLDVRQIGDCRLCVCDREGRIRFRTIGESVLPEPDLDNPDLALTDLMAYSLHRNLVRNSLNAPNPSLKRYRRQDLPLTLESGDRVLLYSDGIDDLFSPEELVRMMMPIEPKAFVRTLLEFSERRMKHVSGLLRAERERLPLSYKMRAYPLVHERLNKARIEVGCYDESYRDGASGRWTKPPKCDNLSICALSVA